ncbi:MAG: hypothetical protein AB9Q19_08205 [Candidatus Reddybacter sp.]
MLSLKLLSIDTSIFGGLVKDYYSKNKLKSDSAKSVVSFLIENGFIPFITIHHIQEILQHKNKDVVFYRWSLIGKFPVISWMCGFDDSSVLGSIYDIHQLEVEHLLAEPSSEFDVLRKKFRDRLVKYSTGESFVEKFKYIYSEIFEMGCMDSKVSKEIESLSHLQDKKVNATKLSNLNKLRLKTPSKFMEYMGGYEKKLEFGLKSRGDAKLVHHHSVAKEFVGRVISEVKPLYLGSSTSVYESFVLNAGVRMDQVTPNTTVGELGYLSIYNSKTRQILRSLGLPESKAEDMPHSDSTTWVIWEHLDKCMKYEKRAHGSNMIDKEMSVLALYVDIFTVDKRVEEYFRQLKSRSSVLRENFGNIIKLANYSGLKAL